jgi:hypothetical protein
MHTKQGCVYLMMMLERKNQKSLPTFLVFKEINKMESEYFFKCFIAWLDQRTENEFSKNL